MLRGTHKLQEHVLGVLFCYNRSIIEHMKIRSIIEHIKRRQKLDYQRDQTRLLTVFSKSMHKCTALSVVGLSFGILMQILTSLKCHFKR